MWSSILLAFSTVPRDQQDNDSLNDAVEAMRSTTKQELQHYLLCYNPLLCYIPLLCYTPAALHALTAPPSRSCARHCSTASPP